MATRNFKKRPSDSYEPKVVGEIVNQILQGNSRFAAAYRRFKTAGAAGERSEKQRGFGALHPHTEPCIDLKLLTRRAGPMNVGNFLPGVITRDGEYHFSFVQNAARERMAARRTPCIFRGAYINVHRSDDGAMSLSFRRPSFNNHFTFADFCRAAAEELFIVSGLVEE